MAAGAQMSVVVDDREPDRIVELLQEKGISVRRKQLTVADYVVDSFTAVERKTVQDFVNSLFDGRLLDQCARLSEAYQNPVLIVEGDFGSVITWRKNPRAYWGALAALALERKVVPFFTPGMESTADLLYVLAKRGERGEKGGARVEIRHRPRVLSLKEKQLYVVEGLPGVGPELADRMLRRFGSVRSVMKASWSELMTVEGIGRAKAGSITHLLDAAYSDVPAQAENQRDLFSV